MAQLLVMTLHQYDTFYTCFMDQLETQNEQYNIFINSIMPYMEKQEEDIDSLQEHTTLENDHFLDEFSYEEID